MLDEVIARVGDEYSVHGEVRAPFDHFLNLVGMEEGLLPHKRSVESDLEKDIAEERRLAYVGVTRAMDYLTLSRAKSRMKWGKRRESVASRFLFEMQAEPGQQLVEEHIGGDEDDSDSLMPEKQTLTSLFEEEDAPPF